MPRPVITLTTDFGPSSPYVAQMKGVILAIHGDVELVDLSHAVPPQNILAGAATLADAYHYFPLGTIHVAVIDPGVGTKRGIVLAELNGHRFVVPDNGLLALVARRGPPTRIVRLDAPEFWHQPISATFHGRDIMAPVAAHLSRGVDFDRFGPSQPTLKALDYPPVEDGANHAQVAVLGIDAFGNVMTNLEGDRLPAGVSELTLQIDDLPPRSVPVVATYGARERDELVLLVGSSGRLEIAVVGGNAAQRHGLGFQSRIRLAW